MIPLPTMVGELGLPHAPVPVTITYVGGRTGNGFGSSLTLTQPSGIQNEDVGVIFFSGGGSISVPGGWSAVGNGMYYKAYGPSEGSVTITNGGGSQNMVAVLAVFRGVKVASPVDTQSSRSTGSGTSYPATNITATYPRTMLVSACKAPVSSGSNTLTEPSGMTLSGKTSLSVYNCGIAYSAGPAQGASTSAAAWTGSASTFSAVHGLILLRPADT
jgi:hypothetical protein